MHWSILFFFIFTFQMANAQSEDQNIFSAQVYFDFGKHDLRPEADSILEKMAAIFLENKNTRVKITAHTDSIGSLANNQALSQRRGERVKNALMEKGVPEAIIDISFRGETTPAAANVTEEGRQKNRRATIDLLKTIPLVLLEGRIRDADTQKGLVSTVVVRTKNTLDTLLSDSTGYFSKYLPDGTVAGVDAFAPCYFFATKMTKATPRTPPLEIVLSPARTGRKLALDNLYFLGGLPVLLEKSKPELPKILKFMLANPSMKIEIAGHVNVPNEPPIRKDNPSFTLSLNRAKVVYNYLKNNGIEEDRISYQGYGNWEMVYPNAKSSREQALNRRVELRVLEGGCD